MFYHVTHKGEIFFTKEPLKNVEEEENESIFTGINFPCLKEALEWHSIIHSIQI